MTKSETLKDLRIENKKTRREVADVLGVSVQAIGHYENGRREIDIRQVLHLSKLYDEPAETIINAQINSLKAL